MADMQNILEAIGGLFLILYGIHLSGVNIQKILGSKLEEILKGGAKGPARGLATGALITGVINSSGTTTVMLFGLITGGIVTLADAVPVMLGASIGSTAATQLASFHADKWGLSLLILGVFIHLSAKRKTYKSIGEALIGLSFIFVGMGFLFDGAEALSGDKIFMAINRLLLEGHPLIAMMTGAIVTLLLQSATAASILAVALGAAGVMDLPAALYLIIGINLGSSLKVVYLALRGENFSGKLAFIHLLFNLTGSAIVLALFPYFREVVEMSADTAGRQIANAHTLYNVISAIIFLPLIPAATKLSRKVSEGMEPIGKSQLCYLDRKLISTPSVSLAQVNRGAVEMANISFDMLDSSREMLFDGKAGNIEDIRIDEEKIDLMTGKMTEYAIWISQQNLSHADKMKLFSLMHVLADLEHLTDHILALSNIFAEMTETDEAEFSEKAKRDLGAVFGKLKIMQNLVIKALREQDQRLAGEIKDHENKVDEVIKKVADSHERRMRDGSCSLLAGKYYMEILYNLERVGDYYDDIAFAITDSFRKSEKGVQKRK